MSAGTSAQYRCAAADARPWAAPVRSARRDHPARVEDSERIERRLDRSHDLDHVGADLVDQHVTAGDTDAVLGGDRPAQRDRLAVEIGPGGLGDGLGGRVVAVEDEVRVEVAVAGMAERGDPDVVAAADALDRRAAGRGPGPGARRRPPSGRSPAARAPAAPAAAPGAASRPPGRRRRGRPTWRRPPRRPQRRRSAPPRRPRRAGRFRSSASPRHRGRGPGCWRRRPPRSWAGP